MCKWNKTECKLGWHHRRKINQPFARLCRSRPALHSVLFHLCVCLWGDLKGRLSLGGFLLFMVFHLVLAARYQLRHCPFSCSSCNIHFIFLYLTYFVFSMYVLIITCNESSKSKIKVKVFTITFSRKCLMQFNVLRSENFSWFLFP